MSYTRSASLSAQEMNRLWPRFVATVTDYAMLLLDADGRIVAWNRSVELLTGYEGDEIAGQHFSCLYPQDDAAAGKPEQDLREAASSGHAAGADQCLRKDGSRFLSKVHL